MVSFGHPSSILLVFVFGDALLWMKVIFPYSGHKTDHNVTVVREWGRKCSNQTARKCECGSTDLALFGAYDFNINLILDNEFVDS